MNRKRLAACRVVIALLAAGMTVLRFSPAPVINDRIGVRKVLPDVLAGLKAEELRYCHNDQCARRAYRTSELKDREACPACGKPLHGLSLGERQLLPADTEIIRRVYRLHGQDAFYVTIAVSGTERRSIHRPQVCLVSQGNAILNQRVVEVPLKDRGPLGVMLLDLRRGGNDEGSGQLSCYAYWFVTEGRETPGHLRRLLWMTWDSIVHNTRRRWAYISVATYRNPDSDEHVERLRRFIAELHPLLTEERQRINGSTAQHSSLK